MTYGLRDVCVFPTILSRKEGMRRMAGKHPLISSTAACDSNDIGLFVTFANPRRGCLFAHDQQKNANWRNNIRALAQGRRKLPELRSSTDKPRFLIGGWGEGHDYAQSLMAAHIYKLYCYLFNAIVTPDCMVLRQFITKS